MKFTLSWLKAHLDTDADLAAIARTASAIGLEVEGIEDRGAALASFRIARVVEAVQHPDADRLRALKVDPGDGRLLSVVCGAPNARAGMKGVLALPGDFIPGTGITLKKSAIRGVASEAMMLSAREMGLGDDHTGIVDLPADAPVGETWVKWAGLDDPVIEIAVTPNRGDALSVRGVARDLAAAGLGTLRPWAAEPVPGRFPSSVRWAIEDLEACPWVIGRTVRGVRNGPSPRWLQDRLTAIGLRPISALVDVTNLLTIDLGRPAHVFDVRKVAGGQLTMRRGDGAPFLALNGKEYAPGAEDCVIADAAGPQSLAGVIGGEMTGCDEATVEAFIEIACFDPVRIALTGRRHGITTDARVRFERGIDPALVEPGLEAITRLILDLCGGEASEVVAAGAPPAWRRSASMRFERLRGLGGADVPADEAEATLNRLGFATEARDAERITVAVPPWRNDVASTMVLEQAPHLGTAHADEVARGCAAIEVECELVEEVLRIHGLDRVAPVSLPRAGAVVPVPTLTPRQTRAALARRVLAARGYAECVTFSFLDRARAGLFGEAPDALTLANPIASDLDQLRPTPLASLALAVTRNAARGYPDIALAEVGPGWVSAGEEGQRLIAAGLRAGFSPRTWLAPSRAAGMMDAKADAWALMAALGVPLDALTVSDGAPAHYHPGRSGVVRQGPRTVVATFGEIHPRVTAALDLPPSVAFEVMLDAIADPRRRRRAQPDLPPFQPVRRDFAFIVDRDVPAETLLRAARGADRVLIAGVTLFDLYEGERIEAGRKSLAIEVTLQPRERTLTDAEIEAAAGKVVAAVIKATGATLRG